MVLKEMEGCQRPVHTKENNELLLPYEEGNTKDVCELLVHAFGCAHFKEDRNRHRRCGSLPFFWPSIAVEGKFQCKQKGLPDTPDPDRHVQLLRNLDEIRRN